MTIALLFMVLFDTLITKSTGGYSLTQVDKNDEKEKNFHKKNRFFV